MLIQKYKATLIGSDIELIGYVSETRKHTGSGTYNGEIEYVISVTELSMPNSVHRGCFIVDANSIQAYPNVNSLDMFEFVSDLYSDIEMYSDLKLNGYEERLLKIIEEPNIPSPINK